VRSAAAVRVCLPIPRAIRSQFSDFSGGDTLLDSRAANPSTHTIQEFRRYVLLAVSYPAMTQILTAPTNLERQDSVVFYPTYGVLEPDGVTWRIPIAGSVSVPGVLGLTKRLMLRLLQRVMQADQSDFQTPLFQSRIRGFVAAVEHGKRVAVRVGRQVQPLQKKTTRLGYFSGAVRISVGEMHELRRDGELRGNWLQFRVASPHDEHREFVGRAQLLPSTGVSVVTDIDDTIKHTEVTCRRSLLRNTFLREFLPIRGMPELYQQWAAEGAAFHYVSSSPWQLYDPLWDLCESHGFPEGTFHLRMFRLRDHMLRRLFLVRRPVKGVVIKSLLKTFPQRKFVLVGDSGERDPEIYGALARRFPQQVAGIYIRELPERPMHVKRTLKAFRHLSPRCWAIFHHPEQIAHRLPLA
jgi:phosphatidate phosphatase APP1